MNILNREIPVLSNTVNWTVANIIRNNNWFASIPSLSTIWNLISFTDCLGGEDY